MIKILFPFLNSLKPRYSNANDVLRQPGDQERELVLLSFKSFGYGNTNI